MHTTQMHEYAVVETALGPFSITQRPGKQFHSTPEPKPIKPKIPREKQERSTKPPDLTHQSFIIETSCSLLRQSIP